VKDLIFIIFSLLTLFTAAGVVLSKNVIYSAFNLVLCFFGLATLYLLWGATFISMIQILIYAGAIVVLFVFVVMLLNFEKPMEKTPNLVFIGLSGIGVWVISLLLLRVFSKTFGMLSMPEAPAASTVRTVSKLLFTQYLWPFEVLTVFLLALIIGIFLVARPEKGGQTS
jgi:NADH-quinone oxidoreductase subunit J